MAGANFAGLKKVFDDTAINRIKTCELHFKDHRNRKARKLNAASAARFKSIFNVLLSSTTEDGYESSKDKMESFIAAKKDRAFLPTWLSWWHTRRGFIFRAFTPQDAPQMNKAEVIQAGWAHRDRQNLSMVDVCQADTRDSLLLDIELIVQSISYFDPSQIATEGFSSPFISLKYTDQHMKSLEKSRKGKIHFFTNKI